EVHDSFACRAPSGEFLVDGQCRRVGNHVVGLLHRLPQTILHEQHAVQTWFSEWWPSALSARGLSMMGVMAETNTAPETFDELAALLRTRMPQLTRSQQLLAERVLSDPEGVAFMTVTELAKSVGINESTVVRFAAGLGLDGYPGLARLCRERLREQAQLLRRFANVESLAAQARDPLELAVAFRSEEHTSE